MAHVGHELALELASRSQDLRQFWRARGFAPGPPQKDACSRLLCRHHVRKLVALAEQAALRAQDSNQRYWATLGLGDVAMAQGNLPGALQRSQCWRRRRDEYPAAFKKLWTRHTLSSQRGRPGLLSLPKTGCRELP
jgi:hypothetical protein